MYALGSSLWNTSTADYEKNHKTKYIENEIEQKLKSLADKAKDLPLTPIEEEKAQHLIQRLSRMQGHAENSLRKDNYVDLFANAVRYGSTWVSPAAAGITTTVLDKSTKPQYENSRRIRKARQTSKGQPRRPLRRKQNRRRISKVKSQKLNWMPDANSVKAGVITALSTYCFKEYITPLIWSVASQLLEGTKTVASSLTEQYIGPLAGKALSYIPIP